MKGRLKLSYVSTLCLAFMLAVAVPFLASAEMTEEWVVRYNSPADGTDSAIAIDALGNVYVTGGSEGSGTGYDYARVKYGEIDEVEVTMELPVGWGMISLPVEPKVATVTTLFPGAVGCTSIKKEWDMCE